MGRCPLSRASSARLCGLVAALAYAGAAAAQDAAAPTDRATVYRDVTVVDGTGAAPRAGRALVVRGERIVAELDADAMVSGDHVAVDARGLHVVPGLVNTHVHLANYPKRNFALALMRRDLYGGVTTVRSMGDDARIVADLARAARVGEIEGPDVVYAALFAGPGFFHDDRLASAASGAKAGEVPWLREVDATADLVEAVTLARGAGASAIKIYGNLDARAVRRIAAEAHRQRLGAWAHAAVFPASTREVVAADVDTVSHSCMIAYEAQAMPRAYHDRADVDESKLERGMPKPVRDAFRAMQRRGAILDATLYVYEAIERLRRELPEGRGPPSYCSSKLAKRLGAEAHRLGVEFSAGTDAYSPFDDPLPPVQRELEILVDDIGMSPLAAIRAATLVGARSVGREQEIGTIAPGKLADLVFVRGDPSRRIAALREIAFVVKRGRVYRRKHYRPISPSEFE